MAGAASCSFAVVSFCHCWPWFPLYRQSKPIQKVESPRQKENLGSAKRKRRLPRTTWAPILYVSLPALTRPKTDDARPSRHKTRRSSQTLILGIGPDLGAKQGGKVQPLPRSASHATPGSVQLQPAGTLPCGSGNP
ncbi:predicted protein [Plenodomus lingam JN3]|uniref:Uncharacterized protein n=1 Tax=Leptosphaeria maculans (strain JN3 / isolate v23.1.3 / race Av1-4-5-6-7-8) TaxID=985895 RepID=E5A7E6_LEPMJ|nr:predicted protein [Plenodomus lingam JN3]CBX99541.1 predicted protein [Plenodomus lingam JN3]